MFSKNKKKFKKNFSRKKVFKGQGKKSEDAVLKMDDLSDGEKEKSEREYQDEQKVMKQREQNFKKFLIEQGRSSAAKWETFSEDGEEEIPESPDDSLKGKSHQGKKRKFEKEDEDVTSSKKKPKHKKNSEDSGQKMEKIKANLKAKYDNDKWEKIPKEFPKLPEKSQQRCLGCRELGHLLKDCKVFAQKARDICLKCGSSEHKHNSCPVYKGPRFDYATCFKCKQMGHISKYCPKNAQGIYPDGGSCNYCHGVDHLARDCPKNRRRGGRNRHTKDSKKFYRVNKSRN